MFLMGRKIFLLYLEFSILLFLSLPVILEVHFFMVFFPWKIVGDFF